MARAKPVGEYRLPKDTEELDKIEERWIVEARLSFWAYRRYMRPTMKLSWFQFDMANHLQEFYQDLVDGKRPKLAIEAPPQHGKSDTITDFIAWLAGKIDDIPTIYASFSDRLGVRANLRIQRQMTSSKYRKLFHTRLSDGTGMLTRNRELLEFQRISADDTGKPVYETTGGSFRNTTVDGSITGEGLGLGVIDDPIKGRREANSKTTRDAVWGWMTDDFFTRFSEVAGLLMIMTRWHLDDPVGRLAELQGAALKILRYPAIAEKEEKYRHKGDPLFPELKSAAFLAGQRKVMTIGSWEAIYQQNPIVTGGDTFPVEEFVTTPGVPKGVTIVKSVRYWDKAGTKDGGAYTAGVLMHKLSDGRFMVADVVRGQWKAHDREVKIKQTTTDDGKEVLVWVEQEPGSGGKESAERTVAMLAGYTAAADKVTGDKETRAEPYAAQVQGGNVLLQSAIWNKPFLDEHEFFPNGPYKDQVDAAGGAFAKLTEVPKSRAGVLW